MPSMTSDMPSARIVWAEDDADMRESVAGLLRQHFEVQSFADGQAALEAVRREPPDLVLSDDVLMPRLDGVSLLAPLVTAGGVVRS